MRSWFGVGLASIGVCLAGACASDGGGTVPAWAAGSYEAGAAYSDFLAARFSTLVGDHQTAAHYFRRAAQDEPGDPQALERAVVSALLASQPYEAAEAAREAPASTLAQTSFARIVLAADAWGRDQPDRLARILAGDQAPSLNADVGWLMLAFAGESAGDTSALEPPRSIAPGNRELVRGLLALAHPRALDVDRLDSVVRGHRHRPAWADAVLAELVARAGRPDAARAMLRDLERETSDRMETHVSLGRLEVGLPPLSRREALAASVFVLADGEATASSPALRILYAVVALQIDPDFEPARFALAESLIAAGRSDEAIVELTLVPPTSPRFADALVRIGEQQRVLQRATEAARSLARLDWVGQRRDLRLRAGDLRRWLREDAEAEALYASVAREDLAAGLSDWRVLLAHADALRRLGRRDEANAKLKAALSAAPDQPLVLNDVAYAWVEEGVHLDAALDLLRRAADLRPNDASIEDSLGWALAQAGRPAEALFHLERAAELAPTRPDILEHLGDVYWRLGRQRDAEYEWRRALGSGPDAPLAKRLGVKLASGLAEAEPLSSAGLGPTGADESRPSPNPHAAPSGTP